MENTQFDNPEFSTLFSTVLSLGKEIYVLRDRLSIIEKMLNLKGIISREDREDIDINKPTEEEEEIKHKECDAFMERLFRSFAKKL